MKLAKPITLAALIFAVLTTAAFAGTITGTNGPDSLVGTNNDDRISARGGDDRVFGLRGNDTIDAGAGNDTVYGDGTCAAGAKTIDYCDAGDTRSDDADRISGRAGDDRLRSGGGDDEISGGAGDDRIFGGGGSDHLVGGKGSDQISGGKGNDQIDVRGDGVDRVTCGPATDKVIADKQDSVAKDCESVVVR
jgi:Ca2+-binding RTX toxin-like protein